MKKLIALFMILITSSVYCEDYFYNITKGYNCNPIITNTDITNVCFIPTVFYSDTYGSMLKHQIIKSLYDTSNTSAYKINIYPICERQLSTFNRCPIAITCADGYNLGSGNPVKLVIDLMDSNGRLILAQKIISLSGCL